MALAERPEVTAARKARLAEKYPVQFGTSDAHTVMGVDAMAVANGGAPSEFSQSVMRLAAHAGEMK